MRILAATSCLIALLLVNLPRADGQADGTALIDKALKAMGGAGKVAKLQVATCKFKVTHDENGKQGTITGEAAWQGLDKGRLEGEFTEGGNSRSIAFVLNGDKGWEKHDGEAREAPAALVTTIKNAFYAMRMAYWLPNLKAAPFKLSPLGELKVNGKATVGVTVARKGRPDVALWFDKETGLPAKTDVRLTDPRGKEITIEYAFADFQDVDGVKHPMKLTLKADGNEFAVELSEVKAQDQVEDGKFDQP